MAFTERSRPKPPVVRVVLPVPLDPTGRSGPTRGQARGPSWRQTTYGFYVPSGVDGDRPEQRVAEQAMRLPPGGAVTGWAAGCCWGRRTSTDSHPMASPGFRCRWRSGRAATSAATTASAFCVTCFPPTR